jgi:superfamily I DNA/RNA helicase
VSRARRLRRSLGSEALDSAKGFEFSHVIMCGYLDDRPPEQSILNRRLIYVGMTRATQELVLTASGDHPYIADLEAQ